MNSLNDFIVTPGLIDMHVHFREPGFTHKEDILSGSRAAARGGFTTVVCMPNTNPVIDNHHTVKWILKRGKDAGLIHVMTAGALSEGLNGKSLTDFKKMKQAGACVLSDDGKTLTDIHIMRQAAEKAAELNLLITDHAEPEGLIVARDIKLAEETGARFHLQHISLKESVDLIREAKRKRLPITCETAPHYFALTEAALTAYGANAKMNPPLRTEADRLAIIEGLKDGTIDVIATDHAPHSTEEKSLPLDQAPFGVIGLETAFAVSYTYLVKPGHISVNDLIKLMSTNPAEILGIEVPPNDWAVFDISTPYPIDSSAFVSKGKNTPFQEMDVYGRTVMTVCNGKVVYYDRYVN